MSLSPERYKTVIREDLLEFEHLNHCVDSIWQSLMYVIFVLSESEGVHTFRISPVSLRIS